MTNEQNEKLLETPVRKIQKYKCTKFDQRLRHDLKVSRGLVCVSCRKNYKDQDLVVHHILETRLYPEHARDEGNMMVLCRKCHSAITVLEGLAGAGPLAFYSALPKEYRDMHVGFLKANANKHLVNAFEIGDAEHWIQESSRAIVKWITC